MFFNALVGTLTPAASNERKIDTGVYEDFVRVLMGNNAYLLFFFDKLLS